MRPSIKFCSISLLLLATGCSHTGEKTPPQATADPAPESLGYLEEAVDVGFAQSPINIITSRTSGREARVALNYGLAMEEVRNLGHTVEVDVSPGNEVVADGITYALKQFHFHTPSEHRIDGVTYPMEMHLVHESDELPHHYLVISALFREGTESAFMKTFLSKVPEIEGASSPVGLVDLSSIIAQDDGFYTYRGSLTTPPYTETVQWWVSRHVYSASAEQVQRIYGIEGDNARHIHILGNRRVLIAE